jgi:hypothetical protein
MCMVHDSILWTSVLLLTALASSVYCPKRVNIVGINTCTYSRADDLSAVQIKFEKDNSPFNEASEVFHY